MLHRFFRGASLHVNRVGHEASRLHCRKLVSFLAGRRRQPAHSLMSDDRANGRVLDGREHLGLFQRKGCGCLLMPNNIFAFHHLLPVERRYTSEIDSLLLRRLFNRFAFFLAYHGLIPNREGGAWGCESLGTKSHRTD